MSRIKAPAGPSGALAERLYGVYRRVAEHNCLVPWSDVSEKERGHWISVAIEAQEFARESIVEMVKKLTQKDAMQDAADDVKARKGPRTAPGFGK